MKPCLVGVLLPAVYLLAVCLLAVTGCAPTESADTPRSSDATEEEMKVYHIALPEERHTVMDLRKQEMPGVAVFNSALRAFEPREVFGWCLVITIELEDLIENGMPSVPEREVVDPFGERLDAAIKGNGDKPNALFFIRITWNGTRTLVYRVHDPEPTHALLQRMIDEGDYPRPFDYEMTQDEEWRQFATFLRPQRPPSDTP